MTPALILGALAVWTNRTQRGEPIVTTGCLGFTLAAVSTFAATLLSNSSTAALALLSMLAVQWLVTVVCGVLVMTSRPLAGTS